MNWLDILIVILLVIPALVGLRVGIIKILLSVVGTIVGVILAGRYYAGFAEHLTFISQESLAKIAAFAIILIAVMIVAAIAASILKWVISAVMLGWVNRLGGAILGFFMGMVFCGALLAIWAKYTGITGPVNESSLAGLLLDTFPMILALLPDEFDSVRSFFQ